PFDPVALHGQGGGLAGAVHEGATEGPALVQFVAQHHTAIVASVPAAGELAALVHVGEPAHGPAPRVAQPSGEAAQAAFEEELRPVAPALAEHEHGVVVGVAAVHGAHALGILDLVQHVLVIHLEAALVPAIPQVAEV